MRWGNYDEQLKLLTCHFYIAKYERTLFIEIQNDISSKTIKFAITIPSTLLYHKLLTENDKYKFLYLPDEERR